MSNENKRKTLANCKLTEFTAQANKIRKMVYEYYHAINVPELTKQYAQKYSDVDASDKDAVSQELIGGILDAMLTDHPIETVKIIAALGFMTFEEAEELAPTEALEIVLDCAFSQKVIDFFISVERLGGSGTDSILPVLILLKALISEMNTSDSESQQNTNDTNASASVGDTLESA